MICRPIGFGLLCLFVTASAALGQSPRTDSPADLPAATTQPNDDAAVLPRAIGRKKPGLQEAKPRYPSDPANYPSSPARLRGQRTDPNNAAAQQQSALSQADATSLINGQGYTHVGDVHADPNSIWVWQADAMKNGRRVHLGIDYRGNLLETSNGPAQPCTTPGVGFGAGPMGVGSRLSQATNCSAR